MRQMENKEKFEQQEQEQQRIDTIDTREQIRQIEGDINKILAEAELEDFQIGDTVSPFNQYLSRSALIADRTARLYELITGAYNEDSLPLPDINVNEYNNTAKGIRSIARQRKEVLRPTVHHLSDILTIVQSVDTSQEIPEVSRRLQLINTYLDYYYQEIRYNKTIFKIDQLKEEFDQKIKTRNIGTPDLKRLEDAIQDADSQWRELQDFKNSGIDEKEQLAQSIEDELDKDLDPDTKKEIEKRQRGTGKSKLEIIWEVITGNEPSAPEIPTTDGRASDKIKFYRDLLKIHSEYMQHFSEYGNVSKELEKYRTDTDLESLNDEIIVKTEADLMLRELYVIGGNPLSPSQREAFYVDYKVWRDKFVDPTSETFDKQEGESYNYLIHLRKFVSKGAPDLLPILIKHQLFSSTGDFAREIVEYNGKKVIQIGLKSMEFVELNIVKALNLVPGIQIPTDKYGDILDLVDTNTREAMLAIFYRQSRIFGEVAGELAKGGLWMASKIFDDPRAGGSIPKSLVTGFQKNYKKINDFLSLAQLHLGSAQADELKKLASVTEINHMFQTVIGYTHVMDRARGKQFANFGDFVSQVDGKLTSAAIPTVVKDRILNKFKNSPLASLDPEGFKAGTHRNMIGESMGKHIRETANGVYSQFRKDWYIDMFKNKPKLTYLRLEFQRMFDSIGQIGSTYESLAKIRGSSAAGKLGKLVKFGATEIPARIRLGIALKQVTTLGRKQLARINTVKELAEYKANINYLLREVPELGKQVLRSIPALFVGAEVWTSDDAWESLKSIAGMLVPFVGPLQIITDAVYDPGVGQGNPEQLNDQGQPYQIKPGEALIGTFFLGLDTLTVGSIMVKNGANLKALKQIGLWVADPFIAPAKMLHRGGMVGREWLKLMKDGKGASLLENSGMKKWKIRWLVRRGRLAAPFLVGGLAYMALKAYGESLTKNDKEVVQRYIQLRENEIGNQQTNDETPSASLLQEKWYTLSTNAKELILTYDANRQILLNASESSSLEQHIPELVNINFADSNETTLDVFFNEFMSYAEFEKLVAQIKSDITTRIPGPLHFNPGYTSFRFGKVATHGLVHEWMTNHPDLDPEDKTDVRNALRLALEKEGYGFDQIFINQQVEWYINTLD